MQKSVKDRAEEKMKDIFAKRKEQIDANPELKAKLGN